MVSSTIVFCVLVSIKVYNTGRSRTVITSKMEHFVIIVTGWKPLTIITMSSILDVAAVLDPPLYKVDYLEFLYIKRRG